MPVVGVKPCSGSLQPEKLIEIVGGAEIQPLIPIGIEILVGESSDVCFRITERGRVWSFNHDPQPVVGVQDKGGEVRAEAPDMQDYLPYVAVPGAGRLQGVKFFTTQGCRFGERVTVMEDGYDIVRSEAQGILQVPQGESVFVHAIDQDELDLLVGKCAGRIVSEEIVTGFFKIPIVDVRRIEHKFAGFSKTVKGEAGIDGDFAVAPQPEKDVSVEDPDFEVVPEPSLLH